MQEVGGNKGRTIRRLRPGAPTLLHKRRPRRAAVNTKRPWYDGGPGTPALPGEPCRTPPHPDWSEPEKWAWEQICQGEVADFNDLYGRCPLPQVEESWAMDEQAKRQLSSSFIRMILLYSPWYDAISLYGLRIIGGHFTDKIDLNSSLVKCGFALSGCRLEIGVEADNITTSSYFSIENSCIGGKLSAVNARFGKRLILSNNVFNDIDLSSSIVQGSFWLENTTVAGVLDLGSATVKHSVIMTGATMGRLNMLSARIGKQVGISGGIINESANLNAIHIGRSLLMRYGYYSNINLRGAKIGFQFALVGSVVSGSLKMNAIEVGTDLFMEDGYYCSVWLPAARIGRSLSFINATIEKYLTMDHARVGESILMKSAYCYDNVRLTMASVDGNINISSTELKKCLDLTGTRAAAIIINKNNGTREIILDGAQYQSIGGMGELFGKDRMTNMGTDWFVATLLKQANYSPQPYEQCAKVLREAGQPGKANRVLFAGKVRERQEAWKQGQVGRWAGLWVLQTTIGHGLGAYMFLSLIWVLGLALAGTYVIHQWPPSQPGLGWLASLAYSLDMLLPFVKVAKAHESIVPTGWAGFYFYVHKLMGWLLGFFVVAGLTGITKK